MPKGSPERKLKSQFSAARPVTYPQITLARHHIQFRHASQLMRLRSGLSNTEFLTPILSPMSLEPVVLHLQHIDDRFRERSRFI